jgi:hypothetical protein
VTHLTESSLKTQSLNSMLAEFDFLGSQTDRSSTSRWTSNFFFYPVQSLPTQHHHQL